MPCGLVGRKFDALEFEVSVQSDLDLRCVGPPLAFLEELQGSPVPFGQPNHEPGLVPVLFFFLFHAGILAVHSTFVEVFCKIVYHGLDVDIHRRKMST